MSNKRKRISSPPPRTDDDDDDRGPVRSLRIQAYEADMVRDRPNLAELVEMETRESGGRGGLIGWGAEWVDRFDARLLLSPSSVPSSSFSPHADPVADVGWSELPSDSEDTFFLTPREIAEYRHEKQKQDMERERHKRLKALADREAAEDRDVAYQMEREHDEETWGGSDEEPDNAQLELMMRTATHLLGSPNPVQLEMRILANHGADPRFAFLRGRWKRAWTRLRADGDKPAGGMGALAGYASESEASEEGSATGPPMSGEEQVARAQAERRARAREWMRTRRQAAQCE